MCLSKNNAQCGWRHYLPRPFPTTSGAGLVGCAFWFWQAPIPCLPCLPRMLTPLLPREHFIFRRQVWPRQTLPSAFRPGVAQDVKVG